MGVELDEDPGGAVLHEGTELSPQVKTLKGGWIGSGQVGIVNAGDKSKVAALPIEAERSLNKEEVLWASSEGLCGAGLDGGAFGVRSRIAVFMSVVNGVEDLNLRGIGYRGQGEVSVTTGGFEDGEFVIDSAVFALRVGVVERPVAMNKTVLWLAVGGS